MGMLDSLKNYLEEVQESPAVQRDDTYEKSMLASQITSTVDQIKRINSFDSSIWSISNMTSNELKRKSLDELQSMQARLSSRLSELTRQSQRSDPRRDALEASKWTGQKPRGMSDHDFDRFQRGDER